MRNEMTLLSHLAWEQTSQSFWFQSGSTVSDPLPERSRSIERAIEAASAKSTTRCASRGFCGELANEKGASVSFLSSVSTHFSASMIGGMHVVVVIAFTA